MKKFFALGAAMAAVACSAPAMAQDAEVQGGVSFGVVGGYDHVTLSGGGEKESKDGFAYGAVLGYDKVIGQGTVGVEAEIDGTTVKERNDVYSIKGGVDLYAGARAAYAVAPGLSVYAKAGYTNTRVRVDYGNRYGVNVDGFRVGGGVEAAVTKQIAARVEYRYSDYGHTYVANVDTGISARRQQVMAALVTRF
ncbi:outer membrane protein [Novosphingobium pokkalii]|uniref:Outer membrane protein n=1 Tax=Novosphingobium pokkalii TaxID=1770194 RepID=A0ABV7V2X4_9SPHN|nr:outer membrane beta-barrel protein [Novosphingobium pokkalii]GHC93701.1 hypothetical protein GCM10019060_20960 [Novosphingobium pokkalii]